MDSHIELPENTIKTWETEPEKDNTTDYIKNELELDNVNFLEKNEIIIEEEKSISWINGSIKLIEGENLSHFLQRYPYWKNKNNNLLWNSANKLQFLGNKKYWNYLRNIYYWFRNIKALKILNENFESEILNLIKNPNKEEWVWIILRIYKCKIFYLKEISDEIGNEFVNILENITSKRLDFENPSKALDYCLVPFRNIYIYLSNQKINNKNENPEIEIIAENIIHELNLIEENAEVSDIESVKFNKMLYNSLSKNDISTKKRDKKNNHKFN